MEFSRGKLTRGAYVLSSLSEITGSNKSDWEKGVAVIQDILQPGTEAYEALTPEQRTGLENVQRVLLGQGSEEEATAHLPPSLRQSLMMSGPSTADAYLLSQFAGVKSSRAKQKLKTVVNANVFISGLKALTTSEGQVQASRTSALWSYCPPEWDKLEQDAKEKVAEILSYEKLTNWGFDVFKLEELTGRNSLLFVGWAILSSPYAQHAMRQSLLGHETEEDTETLAGYRFLQEFDIPAATMTNFLRAIQTDYNNQNPYHNSLHAADVTQSLHSMLQMGGIKFAQAEIQTFSALLAAVVHDLAHPGKNNSFQVATKSDVALMYNDQSVLEHFHVSKAFQRCWGNGGDAKVNIFKRMKPKQYTTIRNYVIEAVLHTDMTKHFQTVNLIKGFLISHTADQLVDSDHAWTILHFLLHLSDISNPAKPSPMFTMWTDRCLNEFFDQGDAEKEMGLAVSPLCDRESTDRAESQMGFISYVVLPAFKVAAKCVPKLEDIVVPIIEENLEYWAAEKKKGGIDALQLGIAEEDEIEEEEI